MRSARWIALALAMAVSRSSTMVAPSPVALVKVMPPPLLQRTTCPLGLESVERTMPIAFAMVGSGVNVFSVVDEGAGVNLPPWRLEGVFGAGAVDLISQAGDGALPLVIEVAHRRDSTDAVLCPQDQRILCGHPCHGCVGSNAKHGGALRAINGLKGGAGGSIAVEGAGADKGGDHQSEDGAGSVCPACENCSLWVGQASTCPVGVSRGR